MSSFRQIMTRSDRIPGKQKKTLNELEKVLPERIFISAREKNSRISTMVIDEFLIGFAAGHQDLGKKRISSLPYSGM